MAKLMLVFAVAAVAATDASEEAFGVDDECLANSPDGAGCALSALQLRGVKSSEEGSPVTDSAPVEMVSEVDLPDNFEELNTTAEDVWWSGWSQGGDKMWGRGAGIETVNGGNAHYYNQGMDQARHRCGGPSCALIVNPPGHRTKDIFHIHFVHYHSYGSNLKRELESRVCSRSGWHHGGPCHGKAAFFPGFPGIFSKAMTGGSIHHASLIAWPMSCGGRGTIVELAYGCSVEHQIRGDFNPKFR